MTNEEALRIIKVRQDRITNNTYMRVQELLGRIHASEFIIKTAKEHIDSCEKEISILLSNSEVEE